MIWLYSLGDAKVCYSDDGFTSYKLCRHNDTLPIGDRGNKTGADCNACEDDDVQDATNNSPSGNSRGYLNDKDNDWDLWKGVRAPEDWSFFGWMTFVCLGPTSSCPHVLPKMCGHKAM